MRLFAALLVAVGLAFAPVAVVSAAGGVVFGENQVCGGSGGGAAGCETSQGNPVNLVLNRAVDLGATIAGLICAIFIVVGGVQYITAAGDAEKAKSARNTIVYALVGLLVTAIAAAIVSFVISRLNP